VVQKGAAPVIIELGGPVTGESVPEGQPSGELTYAKTGGTLFETRTRLAESANRTPADWRALGLSALEVHQIEAATVQEGKASVELTRAGTDWKRGDVTVSFVPVSDLLFAVTGARAERLLAPAELKLGAPALTVTLATKDAGSETLTLYPAVQGGVPARASGRDLVLLLPAGTLKDVRDKLKAVREAQPVTAGSAGSSPSP
jgi:hypothetical protein